MATLSVEEFHSRYDGLKPAYEYWDGTAVQKSMPTTLHGIVQFLLMRLLWERGWLAASEIHLRVVAIMNWCPMDREQTEVQGALPGCRA